MKMMVCPIADKCRYKNGSKHCSLHKLNDECNNSCLSPELILLESKGCIPASLMHYMKEVLEKDK